MIQVALESIGKTGSLAILRDDAVLWHWQSDNIPAEKTGFEKAPSTASQFALQLDRALSWCREKSLSIDSVSVANGPGSFTGLRIAITTAFRGPLNRAESSPETTCC